jgi:hypothetical protein
MGTSAFIWLWSTFVLAIGTMAMAATSSDRSSSLDRLRRELDRLHASHGHVEPLAGGILPHLFPTYDWYTVTFRQFPVARVMPPPLKAANVFAVRHADGEPLLINSISGLRDFFRNTLSPVRTAQQARDVAHGWLQAATALYQDGFYQFKIEEESIKAQGDHGGIEVSGKAMVMRGGNGTVHVSVAFDKQGKFLALIEGADLHPGPRPICHATKLLDPDPIVRKIVEQDLLIMGPAAKPYLDEVRKTASPELRRAIDQMWDRINREEQMERSP